MQVAFPFHLGDITRAKAWLQWVQTLGGCRSHSLILMPSKDAGPIHDIRDIANASWGSVEVLPDREGITGWPQGPNSNMRQLVMEMYGRRSGPVFHVENDCIPLVPDWIDQIEAEYQRAGKPFMGELVQPGDGTPDHITGNMVMPWNAMELAPMLCSRGLSTEGTELAFDIAAAPDILKHAHRTTLIQQVFNTNGEPPTFPDAASLSILRPGAVMFHRCKDESLIQRLMEQEGSTTFRYIGIGSPESKLPIGEECDPKNGWEKITPDSFRPNVHTYFSPVESEEGQAEQQRILTIWREQWSKNGWEPVVLTEEDARKHPEFEKLKAHFASLPTINAPGYELACWLRWVAMAAISGRNLMVDYDCLPFGYEAFYGWDTECNLTTILSDEPAVPFAVMGSQGQFGNVLGWMSSYEANGNAHTSDMLLLQLVMTGGRFIPCPIAGVAKEYGAEGWQSAKLVHFGHYSTAPRLRSEVMREAVLLRDPGSRQIHLSPTSVPATLAEQFRSLSAAMVKLIDGKPGRKAQLQTELRNAGLIGAAKQRAKRKSK